MTNTYYSPILIWSKIDLDYLFQNGDIVKEFQFGPLIL